MKFMIYVCFGLMVITGALYDGTRAGVSELLIICDTLSSPRQVLFAMTLYMEGWISHVFFSGLFSAHLCYTRALSHDEWEKSHRVSEHGVIRGWSPMRSSSTVFA